jgi:hypothetical protein
MKRSVDREVDELHKEIDATRVLMVYKRRNWYALATLAVIVAIQLHDLSIHYPGVLWALVFPLHSHGHHAAMWLELWLRATGVVGQVGLLVYLFSRGRMPDWLVTRIPITGLKEEQRRLHELFRRYPVEHFRERVAQLLSPGTPANGRPRAVDARS